MTSAIRLASRTLAKNRGVSATAIAMLALGIGVNAAVFTVVNSALFEGWPLVQRTDRIVQLTTRTTRGQRGVNYPDFVDWQSEARSFEGMALIRGLFHTLGDGDGSGTPETRFTTQISPNTFQLLGVRPILGRDFSPSDGEPGAPRVVVLGFEVWSSRFGANPAIVGQTVRLDGFPATVIGVMPEGFSFPSPYHFDLCEPLMPPADALKRGVGYGGGFAFARLVEGVTVEQARAEMETIGRRLEMAYPDTNRGIILVLKGFEDWFIGPDARTVYRGMWAAVAFVLLIVCANVANLLVEQAMSRSHEIAIRLALGAGRWRIVRQFLAESVILSLLAGILGWWIAKAGVRLYALAQLNKDVLTFRMDQRVLVYFVGISIVAGLVAGLATATYLTKLNIHTTSKDDGRGVAGGRRAKRLSGLFVGAEMILAVVLLASAGVIVRSFLNVSRADLGANIQNVLAMDLYAPPGRFPNPEARRAFDREIKNRLQALPGVEAVSFGPTPTNNLARVPYELADTPTPEERSRPEVGNAVVGTAYFRTLGARVIAGREFEEADQGSSIAVAIVNQRFADQNWPGEAALGKRLRLFSRNNGKEPTPWLTVVGVASNIVQNDRTRQARDPLVYVPGNGGFALVRTSVAPGGLAATVKREVYTLAPDLPAPIWTVAENLERSYAFERNVTVLFLVFAVVALLVASVGLYAVVAHSVNRRIQEIGIRMAIGATGRDIFSLVFSQAVLPVGVGLAIGLSGSFALNRVLKSQLVGVSRADPMALVAASAVLVLSATLGCLVPARRAMRVDPAVALRHE